jgi:lipopolysaccharide heptosyltransferase II
MSDFCFYGLYRAGTALFGALPLRLLFRLGQFAGFCAWLILPHYRKLAFRNAAIAFGGEKTPGELRQIVRRHFRQLGANLFSSVKIASMSADEIEKHVEIENLDAVHQPLRGGRPVVLLLSHLGNWELCAQILPKYIGYVRNSTIYQRLGNRLIDEHVRKARARTGVEMFDRKEGFRKAIQLLRGGGAIGILSDQHAGDQGLWVPFFGKLASTTPLPALLAKRTNGLLVGIAFYTSGVARWRIVIGPVLETKEDSIETLTAKANELIARQIRQAPDDWFWVHNRWKTPRPNFLLRKYKRGLFVPPEVRAEQLKPFRILIRGSNWLGDAVMSVPAVRAIKKGRPDAHVTVATPKKIAAMWRMIPEVDDVIALPSTSLFSAVRAFRRTRRFDVAVLFPNSLRVTLEAWLAGIPRRVGYRGHARAWLINQVVRPRTKIGRIEHQAVQYLRIAHNCGAEVREPGFEFSLSRNKALQDNAKVALCPGAEYGPAKRWLPERFTAVASVIAAERSIQWTLFGTAKDADVGQVIAAALGAQCLNRIGQTTLQQLIDELQECRLLLTNDTGTMHLGAMLGVPTVAIFGSTEPLRTGPLGEHHIVLRHHVECSPCFLRECPIDFRCMHAVLVEETIAAVRSVLQSGNGAAAAK